jgi:signal transduction histidine kinase
VKDNGCGIPEAIKDQIFDMFFRASHKNSGSGLGLFIASEAAKSIDGLLTVESWEGEGSKFILTIPG